MNEIKSILCSSWNNFLIFYDSDVKRYVVVGLVDIFESGWVWSHMRDFIYIKCCAKGFFSEMSIYLLLSNFNHKNHMINLLFLDFKVL